jgi:hypothetical protein
MKFVGRLMNIVLYVLIIVSVTKKYLALRAVGGIYGVTGKAGKNTMDSSSSKIFDKACKGLKAGELWTDKSFPATMDSIKGNATDLSPMPNIENICDGWKRATDFKGTNEDVPVLFLDGISPNDVAQGSLGDCYYLAALATLAEWPHRIKKVFLSENTD